MDTIRYALKYGINAFLYIRGSVGFYKNPTRDYSRFSRLHGLKVGMSPNFILVKSLTEHFIYMNIMAFRVMGFRVLPLPNQCI